MPIIDLIVITTGLARATALAFALIELGVLQDDQLEVWKMKEIYIEVDADVAVSASGGSVT